MLNKNMALKQLKSQKKENELNSNKMQLTAIRNALHNQLEVHVCTNACELSDRLPVSSQIGHFAFATCAALVSYSELLHRTKK